MIYTRKFSCKTNRDKFAKKLHPNRIVKTYEYLNKKSNKPVFVVKYYRNTKKLRRLHNFSDPEMDLPHKFNF